MTGMTVSQILEFVVSIVTTILAVGGQVLTFVTSNPILLIFLLFSLTGIVIGTVKSFIPGQRRR